MEEPIYAVRRKGFDHFFTCDKERYDEFANKPDLFDVTIFYTAPPKREWVGMTDEERYLNDVRSEEEIEYARAIEAKLKEKNHD